MLRQMVQFIAQRLMELDVEGRCGAGYDEKSAERLSSRNGYRERSWDTRAGSVELKIPRLRQGSYFPEFLEPRRTAEKALTAVIQEAYVQGMVPKGAAAVPSTVRAHALASGERLDAEGLSAGIEPQRPSAGPVSVGLDGGYVRHCHPERCDRRYP